MTELTERYDGDTRGFGLYVHWPFCLSKCPYCDFNSHVRESVDQTHWRAALLAELDHYGKETAGRSLTSVFFGGGTPSLMPADTVAAILDRAAIHWRFDADAEITLEANPTSVEASRLADFREAGIARISLGVQALDDEALRFLGRGHSAGEALAAVELAAKLFDRYSFDLIYARPNQTPSAWRRELERALAFAGDHLSVYQLTIEPGTVFAAAQRRGELTVPGPNAAAALYEITQSVLCAADFAAYEISNHAKPGGSCRHNLTYWRYGDYVGIGPGAHGRLSIDNAKIATQQYRAPETWLDRVERSGHATQRRDVLDTTTRCAEMTMMGLRLNTGIPRADFEIETGLSFANAFGDGELDALIEGGFLILDDAGLRATEAGRQRLDAMLARLLT